MLNKNDWRPRLCLCLGLALTALLLWRWQRIFFLMCVDYIISDVPNHVKLAMQHADYGLTSYVIRFLWSLRDEHFGQTALSLVLTANQLFGIVTVWLLLRRLLPGQDGRALYLAAVLAHICGPWIIPGWQTEMYLNAYNGNVLHNMTVLFSRSFIPLALMWFFDCWDHRRTRLPLWPWLGLTASLLIATLFKPNFAFAFLPLLAVLLICDLVQTKGRNLKNEILLGLPALAAGLACIAQYLVLFADNFAGTSSGMTVRLLWGGALIWTLCTYLRGLLLPLWTLPTQGRREAQHGHIALIAAVNAVAILEAFLFAETGYRVNDGNFTWGCLSLYPSLFALAIALLFAMGGAARSRRDKLMTAAGSVLLAGHLAVGLYCLYRPDHAGYDWCWF